MATNAFMAVNYSLSDSLNIGRTSFFATPVLSPAIVFPISLSPPASYLCIRASKIIQGKVVCASNDKTVSVLVTRLAVHPKYKKRIKSSKKYHAHDPDNKCKDGDIVTLANCAPVSKTKKFIVVDVKQGRQVPALPGDQLDPSLESESQSV